MVRERIELNRSLPPAAISGRVLHELCSHALDVVPEECCGLIMGVVEERFRRVQRITNIMTKMHLSDGIRFPRDAQHAYYMSEVEYLRAQKEAEARGEVITAVYHSHVGAGAYLSREDLIHAEHPLFPFPAAAQIVLSVLGGKVEAAAIFEVNADGDAIDASGGRLLRVVER